MERLLENNRKRATALFAALLCALVLVWGTTAEPAAADFQQTAAYVVPATLAGEAAVTGAGTVCVSTVVCGLAVVGSAAIAYGGYRLIKHFWGAGESVEQDTYLGYSTTSTYVQSCWSMVLPGTSKTCNGTTKEVPQDGHSGIWQGITWTFLVTAGGARSTNNAVSISVSWTGGVAYLNPSENRRVRLSCAGGTGTNEDFDVTSAVNAVGATSGTVSHIWPAATCQSAAGIGEIRWMYRSCCDGRVANYYFLPNTTPTQPEVQLAPLHKWRTEKICAEALNPLATTTVIAYSVQFREADTDRPGMPVPDCPSAYPVAKSLTVYEGDADGAGSTVQLTWTAPTLTESQTVEFSDCLPGGSAYPCLLRLLKVLPDGEVQCGATDCTSFDPDTSQQTEYQCRWGTHVMPLTDCRQFTQTEPAADPSTGTQTGTSQGPQDTETPVDPDANPVGTTADDGGGCVGGYSWNPINWVLKPVKCALSWAFVPKQDHMADIESAYSGSVLQALATPVNVIVGSVDAFRTAIGGGDGDCHGPSAEVPLFGASDFTFEPLNGCSGPAATAASTVRTGLSFVFLVLGGIAVARVVLGAFGFKVLRTTEGEA